MFKNFKFNQSYRKIAKKSMYEREFEVLHELSASNHENVEFEYSTVREARNALAALIIYIAETKMSLEVAQRNNFVYACKKRNDK